MTEDATYVIVGAKQIQQWLARTPRLRFLRGGSRALKELTDPDAVRMAMAGQLAAVGATVDADASAVDGVIVVTVAHQEHASEVAVALVNHLARQLPGLPWEAWWGSAPDYVTAVEMKKKSRRTTIAAQIQDIPFAAACDTCRHEPARYRERVVDETLWIGDDCKTRLAHHDRPAVVHGETKSEVWSRVDGQWAADFRILATEGGRTRERGPNPTSRVVGRHASANHVATVCADGNRIGDLFDALSKCPEYAGLRERASKLLNETLQDEVEAAAAELSHGARIKVGIPHYVGGDDLLVSVRADAGWLFAHSVLQGFAKFPDVLQEELGAMSQANPSLSENREHRRVQWALDAVSIGIGLVFSHASTPFDECQRVAHSALTAAKRATRGRESAVCWVDLTEGSQISQERVITATTLAELLGSPLTGVAALPASARSQLTQILTAAPDSDRARAVENWWQRTKDARSGIPEAVVLEATQELPAALSRARWWPIRDLREGDSTR